MLKTLDYIGRVGLASLFLLGGINKIANYATTQASMTEVGLEPASILLPLTILLEIGGGVLLIYGKKAGALAALILAAFTIATNFFFHDFWTMSDLERQLELSLFFKNVSIAGGLVFLSSVFLSRK